MENCRENIRCIPIVIVSVFTISNEYIYIPKSLFYHSIQNLSKLWIISIKVIHRIEQQISSWRRVMSVLQQIMAKKLLYNLLLGTEH